MVKGFRVGPGSTYYVGPGGGQVGPETGGASYPVAAALPPLSAIPTVSIHTAYWPFSRMAILPTAHSIHRSFELMKVGKATFNISRDDPGMDTNPDVIKRGNIAVIESPVYGVPPWVGPIVQPTESLSTGEIQVNCQEMSGILDVRLTRQRSQFTMAAGKIFQHLMIAANGHAHSGLFVQAEVEPGPSVSVDLGATSVLSALGTLFQKSGYEWWLDSVVTPARVVCTMNFGYRQGFDRAKGEVTLYEGTHFNDLEYTLDTQGLLQSVTVYGGVGPTKERAAVTRTSRYLPQGNELGTYLDPASEAYVRSADIPPTLRSESVLFDLSSSDRSTLSDGARRALERGSSVAERFRLTVGTLLSWSDYALGNYIQVVESSLGLGALSRKVRITGAQPDEEAGEIVLVTESPLN